MGGDYQVIYDVAAEGPPFAGIMGIVALVFSGLLATILTVAVRDAEARQRQPPALAPGAPRPVDPFLLKFVSVVVVATALTASAMLAVVPFQELAAARRALREGTAFAVEGPVRDFHVKTTRRGGISVDRFTVAGVEFAVPPVGPGYQRMVSEGSPIRDGLEVRVHAVPPPRCQGRCPPAILRLEVRR